MGLRRFVELNINDKTVKLVKSPAIRALEAHPLALPIIALMAGEDDIPADQFTESGELATFGSMTQRLSGENMKRLFEIFCYDASTRSPAGKEIVLATNHQLRDSVFEDWTDIAHFVEEGIKLNFEGAAKKLLSASKKLEGIVEEAKRKMEADQESQEAELSGQAT